MDEKLKLFERFRNSRIRFEAIEYLVKDITQIDGRHVMICQQLLNDKIKPDTKEKLIWIDEVKLYQITHI